ECRLLPYPEQPTHIYALHRHRQGVDPVAAAQAAHPRRVSRSGSQEIHLALGFAHCIQGDVLEGIEEITAGGELAMASGSYVMATWCFALALNIRLWQCATDR